MGKQSARMVYKGNDHKDIFFKNRFHMAMVKDGEVIWCKLLNDCIISNGFIFYRCGDGNILRLPTTLKNGNSYILLNMPKVFLEKVIFQEKTNDLSQNYEKICIHKKYIEFQTIPKFKTNIWGDFFNCYTVADDRLMLNFQKNNPNYPNYISIRTLQTYVYNEIKGEFEVENSFDYTYLQITDYGTRYQKNTYNTPMSNFYNYENSLVVFSKNKSYPFLITPETYEGLEILNITNGNIFKFDNTENRKITAIHAHIDVKNKAYVIATVREKKADDTFEEKIRAYEFLSDSVSIVQEFIYENPENVNIHGIIFIKETFYLYSSNDYGFYCHYSDDFNLWEKVVLPSELNVSVYENTIGNCYGKTEEYVDVFSDEVEAKNDIKKRINSSYVITIKNDNGEVKDGLYINLTANSNAKINGLYIDNLFFEESENNFCFLK